MTTNNLELKEIFLKTVGGVELSCKESVFVKKAFRDLHSEYEKVLEDSADDEVKVLAIRHAMASLKAKTISGPEFVSEVIYSVHVLKDKRKRDRMLRSEIAYRMALATYFYAHVKTIRRIPSSAPFASEFLFQINELDNSLRDYHKYKAAQLSAKAA
jgi:hypothetical protein